jgi:hypothetical protein
MLGLLVRLGLGLSSLCLFGALGSFVVMGLFLLD